VNAWGVAWGVSWGDSWGSDAVEGTTGGHKKSSPSWAALRRERARQDEEEVLAIVSVLMATFYQGSP
jgi:hypothetical protein